jgi:hypothetical protein
MSSQNQNRLNRIIKGQATLTCINRFGALEVVARLHDFSSFSDLALFQV